jgi:predicted nucleotidyltransferase
MLLESKQPQIDALCQTHSVKKLELFGSAASGEFREPTSDFDFFVEFLSYESPTIADQWFGLQEDLERLLGRRVDLVSRRAVTNPYFLQVANRHAVTVYAA